MKKIFVLLFSTTLLFTACSDDDDFIDTDTIARTFEIDNVDFVSNDGLDARVTIPVPNTIEVFEQDVPLVYVVDPVATADTGSEVWEQLPATYFLDGGLTVQYRPTFIFDAQRGIFDIIVTLESNDFVAVPNTFTQNQIFRIVIIPSDFAAQNPNIDLSNLDQVQSALNLEF
ncbi:hypothetical protein [Aquimarina algicola]|uniref:Dihydrolipoamide dehydrogenase n=1 Tax=Aquimarina algicola TaxID=2589995 RepID=A0A504JMH1_9FLAO|nr:hypothetical protein [Aquimarina algicola]TPN88978.1 hypothetical protein FHK87_01800 [Aquimarina algicola]